jgi:4-hydroxybenzoate polyprenyltransferase
VTLAAFVGVLAREILNDIEDADGDRAMGRPTVPLILGSSAAYRLSAALWLLFLLVVTWPALAGPQPRPLAHFLVTSLIGLATVAVVVALLGERRALLPRLQLFTKLVLVGQLVAVVIAPWWYV